MLVHRDVRRVPCFCLLVLLSQPVVALGQQHDDGLYDVAFTQPGWQRHRAAKVNDGVLRIQGGPGYRTARYQLPAEAIGSRPLFFTVDVRLQDVQPGDEVYQRPKVKVFHEGPAKPSVQNLNAEDAADWTPITIAHQLPADAKAETVTLELAMQDCGGIAEFRNPRVSFERPVPNVGLDRPGWNLGQNASLDNGVVTIEGGNGYRTARYRLDPEIVGKEPFYFTVDVRLRDIEPGPELFARPKVKVFNPGGSKPTVRKFQPGDCRDWTQVTVQHQLLANQRPPWVKLEVSIQNCKGVVQFRNPRLTFEHPPVETRYPFKRPADVAVRMAIRTDDAVAFPHQLLGVNQQWTWSPIGYEDERVQTFIRQVRPPSLRFPAGTVANYYDWKSDGFERPGPDEGLPWLDYVIRTNKKFAFDDYLALCLELGVRSPLTFNVLSDTAAESVARLRDRLTRNTPIQHIELGNENYFHAQRGGRVRTVEDYIAVSRELAEALCQVDPSIPLAVNVAGEDDSENKIQWDAALAEHDFYDAVVLHPYLGVASARPDTEAVRRMLRLAPHLRRAITDCHEQFGKPIAMSEWGILAPGTGSESIAAAIGIADGWLTLIDQWRVGRVSSACLHMLCRGDKAIGSGLYGLERQTMTIRTSRRGAVYELALATFRDAQLLASRVVGPMLADDLPAVTAHAARHPDGSISVFLVSKLEVAAPLTLTIDGRAVVDGERISYVEQGLAGGVVHWPLGGQPLVKRRFDGSIRIPPLSISRVIVQP